MYIERSWGRWEGVQEIIRGGEDVIMYIAGRAKGARAGEFGKAKIVSIGMNK